MTNQEAIKRIKEHIAIHKYRESHAIHIVEALEMAISALEKQIQIGELPSAQPEIVRCKDCENWIPGYITDNDDFIPPKCGKYQQMVGHSSDDYCSYAERRTDGRD